MDIIDWIIKTENQKGNSGLKQHVRPEYLIDIFKTFHPKAA